jgi:hypothetical protein
MQNDFLKKKPSTRCNDFKNYTYYEVSDGKGRGKGSGGNGGKERDEMGREGVRRRGDWLGGEGKVFNYF